MTMPKNSNDTPLRAALITGGSKRIGRAITLALSRAGYAVVVHANSSRNEADKLCAEISAKGGRARDALADLSNDKDVQGLIPAAAAFGPLTLLVNNAGEFERDEIGSLDRARFDRTVAVNLRAPLFLSEGFAAQAPAGADASIVNLLDQRVFKPTPHFVSYSLTKHAMFAATTMLAQALAPKVRVNAVAPGPVLPSPRQSAGDFAAQAATLPLGRGPSPEEIAQAVVFLAQAASVTGQTIAVDGGQHLAWQTPDSGIVE